MKKMIGMALATLMISGAAANAAEQTWKGKLVDTKCYIMNKTKNVGNDHAGPDGKTLTNCAAACAQMGIPVAVLVGDKVYTLAAPAPSFAKYMAKEATVTGTLAGSVIIPAKVVVDGKAIDVGGMM